MDQKTLVEFNNSNVVFVDYREHSLIEKFLQCFGIETIRTRLDVADYLIRGNIAIERKKASDFINSIVDGRLFKQISELCKYEKPILIVEGSLQNALILRDVKENAIYGALASLIANFPISIVFSSNERETAKIIESLAKKAESKRKEISLVRKKGKTLNEIQQAILEAFPNIGPKLAKRILEHFGSVKNFFNAELREIKKVKGLGEEKARKIYEIINAKYKGF